MSGVFNTCWSTVSTVFTAKNAVNEAKNKIAATEKRTVDIAEQALDKMQDIYESREMEKRHAKDVAIKAQHRKTADRLRDKYGDKFSKPPH